jgi:ketosteroid isomerase-like protein
MLARNQQALVAVYAEDGILTPPNAPMVRGREAIGRFFEEFPEVTGFVQTPIGIEGEGDLACPWGTYELTTVPAGASAPVKDRGKVLAVWHRQADGSWLVERVCWNSDLAAAG